MPSQKPDERVEELIQHFDEHLDKIEKKIDDLDKNDLLRKRKLIDIQHDIGKSFFLFLSILKLIKFVILDYLNRAVKSLVSSVSEVKNEKFDIISQSKKHSNDKIAQELAIINSKFDEKCDKLSSESNFKN